MADADQIYFNRRTEAKLERAKRAVHPGAAAAHSQLAEAYADKLAPVNAATRTK